jgi:Holliday junction resolvasome RuvABC DNA-binding subunit
MRIYIKGQHDKGYFELVKDEEPGFYSVHFKTGNADTHELYGSTKEERKILFQELVKVIPEGAKVSTWG